MSSSIASFLSSNLLVLITVITAVLIITVPILIDRRRHRRELSYRIVSYEALRRGMSGLEVTFNGTPVPEPHLCTFKITNSGRVPIQPAEYSRYINVNFLPCSHSAHTHAQPNVLAFDLVEQNPKNLGTRVNLLNGRLSVEPTLLNPSNSFTVRALLDHDFDHDKLDIDTRIVGIDEVKPPGESWTNSPRVQGFMFGAIVVVFSALAVYSTVSLDTSLLSAAVISGSIIALYSYLNSSSKKRVRRI